VNESQTMEEFLDSVVRDISSEEGFPAPEGCYIDPQKRGKSLWDEPMDASIRNYFDGGETVTVKVFDSNGFQLVWDYGGWTYK